jgi:hypothetical protein
LEGEGFHGVPAGGLQRLQMGRHMCGLLLGPVFGALVFRLGHWRVVTARGGRALSGRVLAREDHSVVCIDKTAAGAGQAFGRFVRRTPWPGHGPHQAHTALRAVLRAARAHGTVAAHTPTHAHTPTRPHARAWQAVAAWGGGEQDQACGW